MHAESQWRPPALWRVGAAGILAPLRTGVAQFRAGLALLGAAVFLPRAGPAVLGASVSQPRAAWLCAGLTVLCAGLGGCGGGGNSADLAPLRLLHSPPIGELTPEQLRALSMECGKYAPNRSMRGRYDAAYCEDAMAAWADAPLQMVTIPPAPGSAADHP